MGVRNLHTSVLKGLRCESLHTCANGFPSVNSLAALAVIDGKPVNCPAILCGRISLVVTLSNALRFTNACSDSGMSALKGQTFKLHSKDLRQLLKQNTNL